MTAPFHVLPIRYTDDVPAMVHFFEALGVRRRVTSEEYAELHAETGRVLVHASGGGFAAGDTYLNLMAGSVEDGVDAASGAGLEYIVWDEAYGRHAAVEGPHGEWLWINEEQDDDYGYARHDEPVHPGLGISGIRPAPDFVPDREFFAHFGFTPAPGGNEWFESLRGPGSAGVIGLHHAQPGTSVFREDQEDPRNRMPLCWIGLTTTEDLDAFATRVSVTGYDARVVETGSLRKVHVIDPDGVEIEVHPK